MDELYTRLGLRLTKSKLGQAVPVAGIAIGAGLNAGVLAGVARDAHIAYRARHLTEKYGVRFEQPTASVVANQDVIDVSHILDSTSSAEAPPNADDLRTGDANHS